MPTKLIIDKSNWKIVCRTCLTNKDLRPLHKTHVELISPAEMLVYFKLSEFSEEEHQPTSICKTCFHELNRAFTFLKRCTQIDNFLQTQFECALQSEQHIEAEMMETGIMSEDPFPSGDLTLKEDVEQKDLDIIELTEVPNHNELEDSYVFNPAPTSADDIDEINSSKIFNLPTNQHSFANNGNKEKSPVLLETDQRSKTNVLPNQIVEDDCHKIEVTELLRKNNFFCIVCGKFMTDTLMSIEMNLSYTCPDCGIIFLPVKNLNKPKQKDENMQQYVCEICDKVFLFASNLKQHTRMHTRKKSFMCEYCGVCFSYQSNFNMHLRKHTGEKPFGCDICNKHFTRKGNLIIHKQMHAPKPNILLIYKNL